MLKWEEATEKYKVEGQTSHPQSVCLLIAPMAQLVRTPAARRTTQAEDREHTGHSLSSSTWFFFRLPNMETSKPGFFSNLIFFKFLTLHNVQKLAARELDQLPLRS